MTARRRDGGRRRLRRRLLGSLFAVAAMGCGGGEAPGGSPSAAEPCARLVTLAPNLTEIAFELGLGERVVGVSDFTTWPPEAGGLPRLGGLFDPNLEQMVALEPDLAIVLPSQDEVARHLDGVGIASLSVGIETLGDLGRAVEAIGERCGVPERGRRLARELADRLAPRPIADAPPTVVVLDRDAGGPGSLLVAGPDTFYQELLDRLGAENVFADAPLSYPTVGLEELLGRAPGAVIEIRPHALSAAARERWLAGWLRYPTLPAVARGQIHLVDAPWALVLGPRVPDLYDELERALRPAAGSA